MEEFRQKLHDLRKEIDSLLKRIHSLKDSGAEALVAARNLAICYTHLEDARMRLGKALEDTGSELPAQFADKANQEEASKQVAAAQAEVAKQQQQTVTPPAPTPPAEQQNQVSGQQTQGQPQQPAPETPATPAA